MEPEIYDMFDTPFKIADTPNFNCSNELLK